MQPNWEENDIENMNLRSITLNTEIDMQWMCTVIYIAHTKLSCILGCGDLSVWEFSGYEPYYMLYDHFIGDPNCLHLVVFRADLPVEQQKQQVSFWLNFIKARMAPMEPIGEQRQLWYMSHSSWLIQTNLASRKSLHPGFITTRN